MIRRSILWGMVGVMMGWVPVTGWAEGMEGWYAFEPENTPGPSAIGMEGWNGDRAGAEGRIRLEGGKLFYGGEEIKLWGLNNTYGNCAPDRELADRRAALYRKFGMNTIRLHKYADGTKWAGIQSEESFAELDPEALDRMDYYVSRLAENGLYIKLSPTFGVKLGAADVAKLPYAEEFGELTRGRLATGHGSIFLARELQDLQIAQTVRLLDHRNPYTGMRYAEDPAVFCVEMFNEDSVLFPGTNRQLQLRPTLRRRAAEGFSRWLEAKYGSEDAWKQAWGEEAIVTEPARANPHLQNLIGEALLEPGSLPSESIAAGTVVPWGQSWHYSRVSEKNPEFANLERRMLDTMEFLIEQQNAFYDRFAEAIRATGFEGAIIASNWKAGSGFSHFWNLWSDSRFDLIDRHNYFGGGSGEDPWAFRNASMLALPGAGMLSSGMQQVEGRPFMLSEWIHVQANEWLAEGPAILGTYGFGLQGWDVSYIFQNSDPGTFSDRMYRHRWDVAVPQILATYAALSRQVRRRDVEEAPETARLAVHVPGFREGKLTVRDVEASEHDFKAYSSEEVPFEALAVTRVAVEFTEEPAITERFDVGAHREDGTYVSTTGELRWTPAPEGEAVGGYFTIDTPRTKGFVGFAPGGKSFELGDVTITPEKGFAVILLTAKSDDAETLTSASEWILVAMARGRNTGSRFSPDEDRLLEEGTAPILLEPVRARFRVPGSGTLHVLDHDGRLQGRSRSFEDRFSIDGSDDRTPFYLVVPE